MLFFTFCTVAVPSCIPKKGFRSRVFAPGASRAIGKPALIKRFAVVSATMAALLFAGPGITATYYVSSSGSDANPGTQSQPLQTLQKGADVAAPGDTVIVMDGVYTSVGSRYPDRVLQINHGGTAGNTITFKAQNRWGAIIDGQNYSTTYGVVLLYGSSYVNLVGFQIRQIQRGALWLYGTNTAPVHDLNITNNWVHDIGRIVFPNCTSGASGAYSNGYVHHVVWDRNLFHDIGRMPNSSCTDNDNYVHDHALYLQGKYHIVTNNIFYNMYAGWAIKVDGFYLPLTNATDSSHVINGNTFAFNTNPKVNGHVRMYANNPPETDSGNTMNFPVNVVIENNISYQPPAYVAGTLETPSFVAVDGAVGGVWGNNPYTGTIVRNNVTTAKAATDLASGIALSGNLAVTDPLFANAGARDFHVTAVSPARSAGSPGGAAPYDFAANPRPWSNSDVGAYQYLSAIAIASPANGTTVSGTISGQISSSVSLSSTVVSVDGATTLPTSNLTFALNTTALVNGAHTLVATGTDATGNSYTTAPVAINVANTISTSTTPVSTNPSDVTPPTLAIANPSNGARVRGNVAISVSASDNVGVVKLSLSIDGQVVSTGNSGSLIYNWQTKKVAPGSHSISAVAADAAGNQASTSIQVVK